MFKKLLLTSALLVTFATALAQSSQNFGVTGTISPSPCSVTLTGGVANLGTVSKAIVKAYTPAANDTVYLVPFVLVPIAVICGAATKVEVSFTDNKSGKKFPVDANDLIRFGITDDTAGTQAIGSYQVSFSDTTIDNVVVGVYLSAQNGTGPITWLTKIAGTFFSSNVVAPGYVTGFAKTAGAGTPDAFKTLSGNLNFQAYLSKAYIDSATNNVKPTGSGTLTLVYL